MFNSITIVGHLGRDPEIKDSNFGQFASFSLALNKNKKDAQGNFTKETTWHDVVVFDKYLLERVKQLHKGNLVLVSGSQEYKEYTDKQGVKKKQGSIHVNSGGKVIRMDKDASVSSTEQVTTAYSDDMPF